MSLGFFKSCAESHHNVWCTSFQEPPIESHQSCHVAFFVLCIFFRCHSLSLTSYICHELINSFVCSNIHYSQALDRLIPVTIEVEEGWIIQRSLQSLRTPLPFPITGTCAFFSMASEHFVNTAEDWNDIFLTQDLDGNEDEASEDESDPDYDAELGHLHLGFTGCVYWSLRISSLKALVFRI